MMYFLHSAVHSTALENIVVTILEPLLAPPHQQGGGGSRHQQQSGIYQMILTPISILRHVSQKSVEDPGSVWLSVVILGIAFVGAALDFLLGNFCRQLAVAVGVRLDAIEVMNPEWDVAGVVNAGSRGSDGKNGNPPIVQFADPAAAAQQQHQPATVPANQKLTAENNMGMYKQRGGMNPSSSRR